MLSLELIRNDPEMVRRAMESRGASAPIDELLELDQQRRSAIAEADQLRARRNAVSRELGQAKERPAELIEEMRKLQGKKTIELCKRYLDEDKPELGISQIGEPSYYRRRTSKDSNLNMDKSLAEQFDLLRTVDNKRYPAYFKFRGHTYSLEIKKIN